MGQCTSSQDPDREKKPKVKKSARKYKQSANNEPHMSNSSKSNGVPEATKINNSSHPSSHGDAAVPSNGVCENSHPVTESDKGITVTVNGPSLTCVTEKTVVPVVLVTAASENRASGPSAHDRTPDGASDTNDIAAENSPDVPGPVGTPKELPEPINTSEESPESAATNEEAKTEKNSSDGPSSHEVPEKPSLNTQTPESSAEDASQQASLSIFFRNLSHEFQKTKRLCI